MADIIECPNCQSKLRLPDGAATVRCPKCKTTLKIEGNAPPSGTAKPAKPALAKKPKVKVDLVDEEAEATEAAAKEKAAKRKQLREALDDLEEKKEEELEAKREMKEYCRKGRKSLDFLYWGVRLYAVGFFLAWITPLTTFFILGLAPTVMMIFLPLCGIVSLASLICMGIGFVYAGIGPPACRHFGWIGLFALIFQFVGIVAQFAFGTIRFIIMLFRSADNPDGIVIHGFHDDLALMIYAIMGINTNFLAVSDAPTRLFLGGGVPWLGVFAGACEFTRMIVLGMLVQHYAELGKAPETGFKAYRVINVFYWTMILSTMFRFAFSLVLLNIKNEDCISALIIIFAAVLHLVLCFTTWFVYIFQSYKLMHTIEDTKEFVTYDRFLAKSAPLE